MQLKSILIPFHQINLIVNLDANNISSTFLSNLGINIPYITTSDLNVSNIGITANITPSRIINTLSFGLNKATGTLRKMNISQ